MFPPLVKTKSPLGDLGVIWTECKSKPKNFYCPPFLRCHRVVTALLFLCVILNQKAYVSH